MRLNSACFIKESLFFLRHGTIKKINCVIDIGRITYKVLKFKNDK